MSETQQVTDLIPDHVLNSPLGKNGYFQVFQGLAQPDTYYAMLNEAFQQYPMADKHGVDKQEDNEERGGKPIRNFKSALGGPALMSFYRSSWVLDCLRGLMNCPVKPTGENGTYSYYEPQGDFLGLHRDIITCELAVITCLYDNSNPHDMGGALCIYPDRMLEPLENIRRSPDQGNMKLSILPGQSLVFLGGFLPHTLMPTGPGQLRVVAVLCYEL